MTWFRIHGFLRLTGVAENIRDLLIRPMTSWKTVLTFRWEELGEVGIRRGIFKGDILSPLLFVVAMIPLSYLLNKEGLGRRVRRSTIYCLWMI